LAEQIDCLLEEKQRRVLGGGSQCGGSSCAYLIGGELKTLGDKCGVDLTAARQRNASAHSYDAQPADQSPAKAWVRNPGGAICRNDTTGAPSPLASWPVPAGSVARASGLESQLAGSAGNLSRPATVKLLYSPPARAAQRWLKSAVAISGFCESGMILPPAGSMGD